MINEISEIINTHTYIVDQWLIDTLDEEYNKGTYSKRENVDALALEKTLRKVGKLKTLDKLPNEKYQWRHDWAFTDDILIDLKRRPKKYNNYSLSGFHNLTESVLLKQLTHVVGYTQNIEHDYKIGNQLTFECEGIISISDALQRVYRKGHWGLLNKKYLQTEKISI